MGQSELLNIVSADIWILVRYMFLFGLVIYIVFALVIVRQVGLMTKTLSVGFELPIKFLAFTHLIASIALFVLAFVYL